MTGLMITSVAFFAAHMIPGTRLRAAVIRTVGEKAYLAVFSLLSLALLALMGWTYGATVPAATLWDPGTGLRLFVAIAMIVPFVLVVAGVSTPNPAAVGGAAILAEDAAPHGIFTVTRHPLMLGIAIWAVLHLIANPDLPSLILFGALVATALYGIRVQDRRKETEIGTSWRRYQGQTSVLPFAAIARKRVRADYAGIGLRRMAAAILLWIVVLAAHGEIFGMPAVIL